MPWPGLALCWAAQGDDCSPDRTAVELMQYVGYHIGESEVQALRLNIEWMYFP